MNAGVRPLTMPLIFTPAIAALIFSKEDDTTFLTLFNVPAMPPSSHFTPEDFIAVSSAFMEFASPAVIAVLIFEKLVAIPTDAVLAVSAKPPSALSSFISSLLKSSKVILPS